MGKRKGIKITGYVKMDVTTIADIGNQPDTGAAQFFDPSATHFGIRQGFNTHDVLFDIYGKGFNYGMFPVPISGTVKKVEVRVDNNLALVLEKLNMPALKAVKMWQQDDPFAAFPKLLKGDDTVIGSEFDDTLYGFKGRDNMWARGGNDIVDGGKDNDVNDGGPGNDYLIDIKGEDRFQFSTELAATASLNLGFNYDRIKFFGAGDDIYLKESIFPGIGDKLDKSEFVNGPRR